MEAGAAKAAVDRMDVVEIAALERARREVAVDGLGGLQVAEGEGAAFLLLQVEQGATVEARGGQLAAGESRRLDVQFLNAAPEKSAPRMAGTRNRQRSKRLSVKSTPSSTSVAGNSTSLKVRPASAIAASSFSEIA